MQEKAEKKVKRGNCIVIGAGDLTLGEITTEKEDLVIAVDGGLSYCDVLQIEPDIIIGDFDSISEKEKEAIQILKQKVPQRIIELSPQKDDTDMLAALRYGLEQGYETFYLYAATGGRLEHTIANIQCLLFLKEQKKQGYIIDGSSMIFVMQNETVHFQKNLEGYLSLFSLGKEAKGVTIQGMKYPLNCYTMKNSYPIGISNEFIGEEGIVSVEEGQLLGILQYVAE